MQTLTHPVSSVDSPRRDTPTARDFMLISALHQLSQRLQSPTPGQPPADPARLAEELELLGAKFTTLAGELRHTRGVEDPSFAEQIARHMQECYSALVQSIDTGQPRWSRA